MGAFSQVGLLLKKNFINRIRQPGLLFLELLWPVAIFVVVAIIRQQTLPVQVSSCQYGSRAMPSAGLLPFMQSYVCNMDNKCMSKQEVDNVATTGARISEVFNDLEPLLAENSSTAEVLKDLPKSIQLLDSITEALNDEEVKKLINTDLKVNRFFKDPEVLKEYLTTTAGVLSGEMVDAVMGASVNITKLYSLIGFVDFKDIVCNEKTLKSYLLFPKNTDTVAISQKLCSIDNEKIPDIVDTLKGQIDVQKIMNIAADLTDMLAVYSKDEMLQDVSHMLRLLGNMTSLQPLFDKFPDLSKAVGWIDHVTNFVTMLTNGPPGQLDFSFIGKLMNDLDPLITQWTNNSEVWTTIKRSVKMSTAVQSFLANALKTLPDTKLTFGGMFKDKVTIEGYMNKTLELTSDLVKQMMVMNIDPRKLQNLIEKVSQGVPVQQVFCVSPGFLSVLVFPPDTDKAPYEQAQSAFCRLNITVFEKEVMDMLDLDRLINELTYIGNYSIPLGKLDWTEVIKVMQEYTENQDAFIKHLMTFFKTWDILNIEQLGKGILHMFSQLGSGFMNNTQDLKSAESFLVPYLSGMQTTLESMPSWNETRKWLVVADLSLDMTQKGMTMYTEFGPYLRTLAMNDSAVQDTLKQVLKLGPGVATSLMTAFTNPSMQLMLEKPEKIQEMLCNIDELQNVVYLPRLTNTEELEQNLCASNFSSLLIKLQDHFEVDEMRHSINLITAVASSGPGNPLPMELWDRANIAAMATKMSRMFNMVMNQNASIWMSDWYNPAMWKDILDWDSETWEEWKNVLNKFNNTDQISNMLIMPYLTSLQKSLQNTPIWNETLKWMIVTDLALDLGEKGLKLYSEMGPYLQTIMEDTSIQKTLTNILDLGPGVASSLFTAMANPMNLQQIMTKPDSLQNIICNITALKEVVQLPPLTDNEKLEQTLCESNLTAVVQNLADRFQTKDITQIVQTMVTIAVSESPDLSQYKQPSMTVLFSRGQHLISKMFEEGFVQSPFAMFSGDKWMDKLNLPMNSTAQKEWENLLMKMSETDYLTTMFGTVIQTAGPILENSSLWETMGSTVRAADAYFTMLNKQIEFFGGVLNGTSSLSKLMQYGIDYGAKLTEAMVATMLDSEKSQKLSVLFQQIESGYTMDVLCSEKIHEYFNFPSGLPVPEMQNFLCNLNVTELTEEIGGLTQISIDFGHKVAQLYNASYGSPRGFDWSAMVNNVQKYIIRVSNLGKVEGFGNVNFTKLAIQFSQFNITKLMTSYNGAWEQANNLFSLGQTLDKLIPMIDGMTGSGNNSVLDILWRNVKISTFFFNSILEKTNSYLQKTNSSVFDVMEFLNSTELNRALKALEKSPEIAEVFMHSIKEMSMNPQKSQLIASIPFEAMCSNYSLFALVFTVPESSTVDMHQVHNTVCDVVSVNMTILLHEVVAGFTELEKFTKMMFNNPNMTGLDMGEFEMANFTATFINIETYMKLLASMPWQPPFVKLTEDNSWLESNWTAFWQRSLGSWDDVMKQYGNDSASFALIRSLAPTLQGLMASFNMTGENMQVLQTISTVADLLKTSVEASISNPNAAFDMFMETKEFKKLLMLMDMLPELVEVWLYTSADPDKNLAMSLFWSDPKAIEKACTEDPTDYLVIPEHSTINVTALQQMLCSINFSVIPEELNQVNMKTYGPWIDLFTPNKTTPSSGPFNMTELLMKFQGLQSLFTKTMSSAKPVCNDVILPGSNGTVIGAQCAATPLFGPMNMPSWLNTTRWQHVFESYTAHVSSMNASIWMDPDRLAKLLLQLQPLLDNFGNGTNSTEIQQILASVNEGIQMSLMYAKMSQGGIDFESLLKQSVQLQRVLKAMDFAPEFVESLLHSLVMEPEMSWPLLEQLLFDPTAWTSPTMYQEKLCALNWGQYMHVPAGSMLNVTLVQSAVCAANFTVLQQELMSAYMPSDSGKPFNYSNFVENVRELSEHYMTMFSGVLSTSQTKNYTSPLDFFASNQGSTPVWMNESIWAHVMDRFITNLQEETKTVNVTRILGLMDKINPLLSQIVDTSGLIGFNNIYNNLMSSVMEVVVNKLEVLNTTHGQLIDFFPGAPETKKLLQMLPKLPHIVEVMMASANTQKFGALLQAQPMDALKMLCIPAPYSNITDYLTIPINSTVDLQALKQEFCAINITVLEMELKGEFNIEEIMSQLSNNASVNWALLASRQQRLQELITKWSTNPPQFVIDQSWMNETVWIDLFSNIMDMGAQQQQTGQPQIAQMIQQSFGYLMPLMQSFENDTTFNQVMLVLDTLLRVTNEEIKTWGGRNLTLEELFSDMPEYLEYLNVSLRLSPQIFEAMLQASVKNPGQIMQLYTQSAGNWHNYLCNSTHGLAAVLDMPPHIDVKALTDAVCAFNETVLSHEVMKKLGLDTVIARLTQAAQKNETIKVDWRQVFVRSEELMKLIGELTKNPPRFNVPTLNYTAFEQAYMRFVENLDYANANTWVATMESMFSYLRTTPMWEGMKPSYVAQQVVSDFLLKILKKIRPEGNVIDFANLFQNATRMRHMMEAMFNLGPDVVNGLMGSGLKMDKAMQWSQLTPNQMNDVFCDESKMEEYLFYPEGFNATYLKRALCGLNGTVFVQKLMDEFSIDKFIKEISQAMNGSGDFDMQRYLATQNQISAIIMEMINATSVRFGDSDLAEKFNFTMVLPSTLLSITQSLPPLTGETFGKFLDELMPFIENLDFWKELQPHLDIMNILVKMLNNKLENVPDLAEVTLADMFKNSTRFVEYMRLYFEVAPEVTKTLAYSQIDPMKLGSINSTDAVRELFCGDAIKYPKGVNVTAMKEVFCKTNLTAVYIEFMREINYQAIAEVLYKSDHNMTLGKFNWTETIVDMYKLGEKMGLLFSNVSLPSVAHFYGFEGNLTAWMKRFETIGNMWQTPTQTADMLQMLSAYAESMATLLNSVNNSQEALMAFKSVDFMMNAVLRRLQGLQGGTITLERLLKNATQHIQLLRVTLDQETLDVLIRAQFNPQKLSQLLGMPNPVEMLCSSRIEELLELSDNSTMSVSKLQDVLCSVNTTVLLEELKSQLDLNKLISMLQQISEGQKVDVDWLKTMNTTMQIYEVIAQMVKTPPKIDQGLLDLLNVTRLEPVVTNFLTQWQRFVDKNDYTAIANMLKQLNPLLLNSEFGQEMLKYMKAADVILGVVNNRLRELQGTSLSLEDLLLNSTSLSHVLRTTLDMDPSIVQALLGAKVKAGTLSNLIRSSNMEEFCSNPISDLIELPAGSTVSLEDLQSAVCAVNATVLIEEFKKQLDIEGITKQLTEIFQSNLTSFDWSSYLGKSVDLAGIINTLLTNPPNISRELMGLMNITQLTVPNMDSKGFMNLIMMLGPMLGQTLPPDVAQPLMSALTQVSSQIQMINGKLQEIANQGFTMQSLFKNQTALREFFSIFYRMNGPLTDMSMMLQSQAMLQTIVQYPFMVELACNKTVSGKYEPLDEFLPAERAHDFFEILCTSSPETILDKVKAKNFTGGESMGAASKLMGILYRMPDYYTSSWNITKYSNPVDWQAMSKNIQDMVRVLDQLKAVPGNLMPHDFNVSQWMNMLEALTVAMAEGNVLSALETMKTLQPMMSGPVWNEITKYAQVYGAFAGYINRQMEKLQADGKILRLANLFPDPQAVKALLLTAMAPEAVDEFMAAGVQPINYLRISDNFEEVMCNRTAFDMTFTLPDGVDVMKMQNNLCRMARNNTLMAQQLLNMMDLKSVVSEVNRILGDKAPKQGIFNWDTIIKQVESMFRNFDILSKFGVDMGGMEEYTSMMASVAGLLNKQNAQSVGAMCDSVMPMLEKVPNYQLAVEPMMVSMGYTMEMMNKMMDMAPDMATVVCDLPNLDIVSMWDKMKNTGMLKDMEKISYAMAGNYSEPYSCSKMVGIQAEMMNKMNETMYKFTDTMKSMQQCMQKNAMANVAVLQDMNWYVNLMKQMQAVMVDSAFNMGDLKNLGPFVDMIINSISKPDQVFTNLTSILKSGQDLSSMLENIVGLSPDIVDAILKSTINLSLGTIADKNATELAHMLCHSTELDQIIRFPELLAINVSDVKAQLCGPNVTSTINLIKDAVDLGRVLLQLSKNKMIPTAEWFQQFSKHIGDIVEHGAALSKFAQLFQGSFDMSAIQELLPQIMKFLQGGGPDKLFDSITLVLGDLKLASADPMLKTIVDDIRTLASGIRGLNYFKRFFPKQVKIGDALKDTNKFSRYLEEELDFTPQQAAAILNSRLSYEVFVNASTSPDQLDDLFCKPENLGTLVELNATLTSVTVEELSFALCNISKDLIPKITETALMELTVGEMIKEFVSVGVGSILSKANVTKEEAKEVLDKFAPLQDDLGQVIDNVANFTKDLPESFAELAQAQVGSPSVYSTTSSRLLDISSLTSPSSSAAQKSLNSLSDLMCGSPIKMTDKFGFGNVGKITELNKEQKEEQAKLPGGFCQEMYTLILKAESGSIIWSYLKPLIQGKILYTPNTPAARRIIEQANGTFDQIGLVREFAQSFLDSTDSLIKYLNKSDQISEVESALSSPFISGALEQTVGISGLDLVDNLNALSSLPKEELDKLKVLAKLTLDYTSCLRVDRFEGFDTEEELVDKARELQKEKMLLASVVFTNFESSENRKRRAAANDLPKHIKYKIRVDIDNTPLTTVLKDMLWSPGPDDNFAEDLRYLRGFIQLQDMIDQAIIKVQTNGHQPIKPAVHTQQFPHSCYYQDTSEFPYVLAYLIAVTVIMSWLFNVAFCIRTSVEGKENGTQETMKIMGLRSGVNWVAWFINSYLIHIVMIIAIVVIMKVGLILVHADAIILVLFFMAYALSTTMMCYLISSFFSRTNLAALVGIMVYLISYLPYILIVTMEGELDFWHKIVASLSSTTAFSYACSYLARFEQMAVGINWQNIDEVILPGDSFSFAWGIYMMLIDSAIYALIGWYVRNLHPGKYGMPQPWYFPFSAKYWGCCGSSETYESIHGVYGNANLQSGKGTGKRYALGYTPSQGRNHGKRKYKKKSSYKLGSTPASRQDLQNPWIEQHPAVLPVGISLQGLTKVYKSGKKLAVDRVSVDFYEGQITAFLGHNGAGKTTTINMLTGMFPPTSGTAFINGKNIITDFQEIRNDIGFCPQHDVLFQNMTVVEHLNFYASLKGVSGKYALKDEVEEMLESIGLWHMRNEIVRNLSGGMKRRLAVAIAFIGGSKVVILDEPTSGVDPNARRAIWDVIGKHRQGRTILLSTHHLDEADIISDTVAVINKGKLLCSGSSMFLKKNFGSGYQLTMAKNVSNEKNECSSGEVMKFIQGFIPSAHLVEEIGTELTVLLPVQQNEIQVFQRFFEQLEANKARLGLDAYGVSDTTLEEVFLKLCTEADGGSEIDADKLRSLRLNKDDYDTGSDSGVSSGSGAPSTVTRPVSSLEEGMHHEQWTGTSKVSGLSLKMQQFGALFAKRFHNTKRNLRGFLTGLILPCLFIAFAMGCALIRPRAANYPSLVLTPAIYEPNHIFYKNRMPRSWGTNKLTSALLDYPGIGTMCMKDADIIDDMACTPVAKTMLGSGTPGDLPKCTCPADGNYEGRTCDYSKYKDPQHWTTNTTEIMYNLDGYNVSDYLLATHEKFYEKRYGGWSYSDKEATVWFNNKGKHAMPSFVNAFSNALLRANIDPALHGDPAEYGITTYNHPIDLSASQLSSETLIQKAADTGIALTILCAFSFIPAGYIVYLVTERLNKEKRLQHVSGVGPVMYWTSALIWDMLNYIIPVGIAAGLMAAFQIDLYSARLNLPAITLLLYLFGWATIPLMYTTVKLFKDTATAYMLLFSINLFIGLITTIAIFLLQFFYRTQGIAEAYEVARYLLLIFPQYCLGAGIIDVTKNQMQANIFEMFGQDTYVSPFSYEVLNYHYIALAIEGAVFFIITLLIEWRCSCTPCVRNISKYQKADYKEDEDVSRERQRVNSGEARNDLLVVDGLSKVYGNCLRKPIMATNNVCFGIPKGECFGLLGVNGAGKTTTFKMLTGDTLNSSGHAVLNGRNITDSISNMDQNVGYCPQVDALDKLLTAREMLTVYAKMKGIPSAQIKKVVDTALHKLELDYYADKTVKRFSGGTKRKLATALALIGEPEMVLLDEPTTGMDPQTKRLVWNTVLKVVRENRSVLLTSHSMAECDALCTRLAIMVNGQFQCMGSPQHLKSKFGSGYTLTVKVAYPTDGVPHVQPVIDFMQRTFRGVTILDQHLNMLEFNIPAASAVLANIFGFIEREKHNLGIEDYSLSQTTLDQVFVNFARQQTDGVIINENDDDYSDYEARPRAYSNKAYAAAYMLQSEKSNPPKGDSKYSLNLVHGSNMALETGGDEKMSEDVYDPAVMVEEVDIDTKM